jgi:HlyD family secretion protein
MSPRPWSGYRQHHQRRRRRHPRARGSRVQPDPDPRRQGARQAGPAGAAGELLLELDDRTIRLAIEASRNSWRSRKTASRADPGNGPEAQADLSAPSNCWNSTCKRARQARALPEAAQGGLVSGEDLLTAELNVKRNEIQLRQQRELIDDSARATASSIAGARLQKASCKSRSQQQQQLLAQTQVRAPFAGMLTWLLEEEGASVATGQLVARSPN